MTSECFMPWRNGMFVSSCLLRLSVTFYGLTDQRESAVTDDVGIGLLNFEVLHFSLVGWLFENVYFNKIDFK